MKKEPNVLKLLWEYIDMITPFATEEELQALEVVASKSKILFITLNKEQKQLFEDYNDALMVLDNVCLREAFIKGIKFANSYAIEVMDCDFLDNKP